MTPPPMFTLTALLVARRCTAFTLLPMRSSQSQN
jgi:hypothetical protein